MARSSANVLVAGSVAGAGVGGASGFSDGGGVRRPRAVCGNARMASNVAHGTEVLFQVWWSFVGNSDDVAAKIPWVATWHTRP